MVLQVWDRTFEKTLLLGNRWRPRCLLGTGTALHGIVLILRLTSIRDDDPHLLDIPHCQGKEQVPADVGEIQVEEREREQKISARTCHQEHEERA